MYLYILSWVSTVIHIIFLTLSLAAGLYYLAELVEEYTVTAGKVIKYILITTTLVLFGLLIFEKLPVYLIGLVILSHGCYALLLNDFPYISLTSFGFIASCVLLCINHYMAFKFFGEVYYSFQEILAYFTICLWTTPFCFFVSLSVNEYVLPTMQTTDVSNSTIIGPNSGILVSRKSKRSGLLAVFDYFLQKKDDLLLRNKRF